MSLLHNFKRENGDLPSMVCTVDNDCSNGCGLSVAYRVRAQNGCGLTHTARPRNFFHEIAKITFFTEILPLEKYPLYGVYFICFHG